MLKQYAYGYDLAGNRATGKLVVGQASRLSPSAKILTTL
jgi:hypothetical protein